MVSLFLAGVLIAFSPCILPALPIIGATALQQNRFGPVITASGLISGFVIMGVALKTLSIAFQLPQEVWRQIAAFLLVLLGTASLTSGYFKGSNILIDPVLGVAQNVSNKALNYGLFGQFLIGVLLGIIWMPCVGPALGGVMIMIINEPNYFIAVYSMALFGLGASLPLLACSYGLNRGFKHWHLISKHIYTVFGVILLGAGFMIIFQIDTFLQAKILSVLPNWWLSLITKY
jgi:cytochrome c-type biogenesis protein